MSGPSSREDRTGCAARLAPLIKLFNNNRLSRITMPLEDRELEQISKLLERGGKMLADHCDTCHSPLFRFEGKVTCPVCSYRAAQTHVRKTEVASAVEAQSAQAVQSSRVPKSLVLDETIAEFVSNLAAKMGTETDLARIQVQLECIERGLRIIQFARGLDSLASNSRRVV